MDRLLRLFLLGLVLGALSENSGRFANQFEFSTKKQSDAKYRGLEAFAQSSDIVALEENSLDSDLHFETLSFLSHQNKKNSHQRLFFRCSQYKSELFCRGPPDKA